MSVTVSSPSSSPSTSTSATLPPSRPSHDGTDDVGDDSPEPGKQISSGSTTPSHATPEIDAGVRDHRVATDAELRLALLRARPGERIVLVAGEYGDSIRIERGGVPGRPLILTAEEPLAATLRSTVTVAAPWVTLADLRFESAGLRVEPEAEHFVVTCAEVRGNVDEGVWARVRAAGAVLSYLDVTLEDGCAVRVEAPGASIEFCVFRDWTRRVASAGSVRGVHLQADSEGGSVVRCSRFVDLFSGRSAGSALLLEGSDNLVEDCLFLDAGDVLVARGRCNTIHRCVLLDHGRGGPSSGIRVHGRNNRILACIASNIAVMAGGELSDDTVGVAAVGTVVARCRATLTVGGTPTIGGCGTPAQDTRVEAHGGTIRRGFERRTTISMHSDHPREEPDPPTRREIGPRAAHNRARY